MDGSSGAGNSFNGASAAHTHMTNSLMTDPEVLETRFPIIVEELIIRDNSGGQGRWHGGNGVIRKLNSMKP